MAVDAKGGRVVAATQDKRIIVYKLYESVEVKTVTEKAMITSLALSESGRHALVGLASQAIHLWDLDAGEVVQQYSGHVQGQFVIRSCLGGINEAFVLSGSEGGWASHRPRYASAVAANLA